MDVGILMPFASDGWEGISDSQVYAEELGLARLADELGFNVAWAAEHHFFGYSFCPDNTQLLSYLAGVTSNIDVGTAAVIMPWNDPLRVAEKVALLDNVSNGRFRFGVGRGLSRREYAPFRDIEMDESRARYDEGTAMVLEALRTGFVEGDGPFFPQERVEIRPRPERSFDDRLYCVASSDDSVDAAARFAGRMTMFADRSWEHRMPSINSYREQFLALHGREAPPLMTADFCLCLPDAAEAEDKAREYMGTYLGSLLEHYEVMGDHFAVTEGYDAYAKAAEVLKRVGESGFLDMFMTATAWGTPDQIIANLEERRELIGPFEYTTAFRYGGIPYEEATASMHLFASEVLPVIQGWD
ncbi:MAG: alkanesulfonate monooxygenase SsuD [Candidatus Poriferisodalaceae bacterium]|jgi:alkanesulfonate monooxygenase SsuD/methylene tetrahydromethanopterin reductase-like flavin-dependent oxidoreductase (luciferase family)